MAGKEMILMGTVIRQRGLECVVVLFVVDLRCPDSVLPLLSGSQVGVNEKFLGQRQDRLQHTKSVSVQY